MKYITFLLVFGFLLYSPTLFHGFNGDDAALIMGNTSLNNMSNIPRAFLGGGFNESGYSVGIYYKPLFIISLNLIYALFGEQPFFFHIFQIILHISVSILLFLFARKFLSKTLAFIVSVIFLTHPINVESVVYISAIQEPLFSLFGLTTLVLILYSEKQRIIFYLAPFLLLLSLLAKETGILYILISLFLVFLKHKRDVLKYTVSLSVVAISYGLLRFGFAKVFFEKPPVSPVILASFSERVLTIPAILQYYLSNFFYPDKLIFNQSWIIKRATVADFYFPLFISLFFLTCLFLSGLIIYKKARTDFKYYLFFMFWFLIGIGLHLQIIPLDMTVSDRWFYFPIISLLMIFGLLLQPFFRKNTLLFSIIASGVVIIFCLKSITREQLWVNDLTLNSYDYKINTRDNYTLENMLGANLAKTDPVGAQKYFERAVNIFPENSLGWFNLGVDYQINNNLAGAKNAYLISINNGHYSRCYEYLTSILIEERNASEASKISRQGLQYYPANSKLWYSFLLSQVLLKDRPGALNAAFNLNNLVQTPESNQIYITLLKGQEINLIQR